MLQRQPTPLLIHCHCYEIDVLVVMKIEYLGERTLVDSVIKTSLIALQSELERVSGAQKSEEGEYD